MRGGKAKDELASQFAGAKHCYPFIGKKSLLMKRLVLILTEKFTKELNTMKEVASRWEEDNSVSVALARRPVMLRAKLRLRKWSLKMF